MKITLRIASIMLVVFLGHTYFNELISSSDLKIADKHADLIVYSFDRPLQLYAFLESVEKYVTGLGFIQVIYRASDQAFAQAYNQVKSDFSRIVFTQQGTNPRSDFKPLSVHALVKASHEYVLFAVDDIIVIDHIDCTACIEAMEKYNAYGFYLRLGKNLTECYSMNRAQRLPLLQEREPGLWQWCFAQGEYDWNYPHTVDMTLYRKKDVNHHFKQMHYWAPNRLEAEWACRAGSIMQCTGLCYTRTKIVNVPLNSVQLDWTNRNMEFMTSRQLLDIFNQGKKIDIAPLHQVNNPSAHMAYVPTFIQREK